MLYATVPERDERTPLCGIEERRLFVGGITQDHGMIGLVRLWLEVGRLTGDCYGPLLYWECRKFCLDRGDGLVCRGLLLCELLRLLPWSNAYIPGEPVCANPI
jgi:hypothetical protein